MSTKDDNLKDKDFSSNDAEDKKMEIEITRYKRFVETFNHPRALAKLIVVVSIIIVLVFLGISIIALVVKSYYPYQVVNSNEYGATIINNEDNEVIYWLFNTADLWANSGIHVKKGDVISVRASGAFHSSIHHLVDDAKANRKGRNWVTPMGGPNSQSNPREEHRSKYRISPEQEFNTLLMQVIPENVELKDNNGKWISKYDSYLDGQAREDKNNNNTIDYNKSVYPDIYAIGAERDKVTIRSDGVLHFAVNDIALTRNIILQMNKDLLIDAKTHRDTGVLKLGKFPDPYDSIPELIEKNKKRLLEGLRDIGFNGQETDTMVIDCECKISDEWNCKYRALYDTIKNNVNKNYPCIDSVYINRNFTELDYYLIRNFVDAWFVDNVGSYLIVIERKKQ